MVQVTFVACIQCRPHRKTCIPREPRSVVITFGKRLRVCRYVHALYILADTGTHTGSC